MCSQKSTLNITINMHNFEWQKFLAAIIYIDFSAVAENSLITKVKRGQEWSILKATNKHVW